MTPTERTKKIEQLANLLNGVIDVPGVGEEFEQTALVSLITLAWSMAPDDGYADMALVLLCGIPQDIAVKVIKAVLPDFLETLPATGAARMFKSALNAAG